MITTQTVVICEGVHDRAFWAGWLLRSGWSAPTPAARSTMSDLHGRGGAGQFIYDRSSSTGRDYCRVIPAFSDTAVLDRAKTLLATGKQTVRLIVSWDSDANIASGNPAAARTQS